MKLVPCWDVGVTTDARLVDLPRLHGAQATFNLNVGQPAVGFAYPGAMPTR
jgi:hypothetical protein